MKNSNTVKEKLRGRQNQIMDTVNENEIKKLKDIISKIIKSSCHCIVL